MSLNEEIEKIKAECEAKLQALKNAAVTEIRKLETWAKEQFGDAAKPADGSDFTVQAHDDAVAAVEAVHTDLTAPAANEAAQAVVAQDEPQQAGVAKTDEPSTNEA